MFLEFCTLYKYSNCFIAREKRTENKLSMNIVIIKNFQYSRFLKFAYIFNNEYKILYFTRNINFQLFEKNYSSYIIKINNVMVINILLFNIL